MTKFQSVLLGVFLLSTILVSSCGKTEPPPIVDNRPPWVVNPPPDPVPVPPPKPKHLYSVQDGLEYGYAQALSDQDIKSGTATKSLLMFSYLGKKDGAYQVMLKDGSYRTVVECALPCEVAKVYTFVGDRFLKKEMMPINGAVLVAAPLMDAMAGYLNQLTGMKGTVEMSFWVDGDKKRLVVEDLRTSGVTR